ncbi:DDRGK domain-containing protein 1 [Daktulosphaira vitifoliae]|uniref:DDRGK domain-containing protein 1 n=1 Tax=Daktulosphaira vitifoliae TaxID=58002 RepID=UPI0021AAD9BF|nr:DDRGK domain-containing protein 1 [Daktulosphaira vitifoliae]XP_050545089.1 DDRGK domain-containing protein 1 [Daktulosphaira vitifoliae]XP_050545090.1 DDRGK domain-containing protein 1 [Daktulosphaira vitifoliae]XP_050545091.1 DDRGK domain-containing protein 1 [Daktulosphaira vitifoliae]
MDLIILLVIFSASVIVGLFGFMFHYKFYKIESQKTTTDEIPVRQRVGFQRQNHNTVRRNARNIIEPRNENIEEDNDEIPITPVITDPKLGAKKRAKLEAKAEKKIKREADLQEREERKKKQELEEAERKAREDHELRQEQERLALEKRLAEEKARKEHQEYLKLKENFGIEEEGYEETLEDEGATLTQFMNYIKENKVVVLDELALQFKLKTQMAIDRIQSLLDDGLLTGVIDDRGKFIFISQSELDAVASFIKKRGRVSLTELAEHSNNLIVLDKPIRVE